MWITERPEDETWEAVERHGLPWFLPSLATRIRKDSSHSASPLRYAGVGCDVAPKRFAGNFKPGSSAVPSVTQGLATSLGPPPPVAATSRYRDLCSQVDLRDGRSLQFAPVPIRKCNPRAGW